MEAANAPRGAQVRQCDLPKFGEVAMIVIGIDAEVTMSMPRYNMQWEGVYEIIIPYTETEAARSYVSTICMTMQYRRNTRTG